MCGIIGIVSEDKNIVPDIMEALRLLEYRGYDSAGVATLESDGSISRRRTEGKLNILSELLETQPLSGNLGIGHTRWATHGVPNENNAHPHADAEVALIHNGIIENFQELKADLIKQGVQFESQTDSEVALQLVSQNIKTGLSPWEAVREALPKLEGAFALVFMFAKHPDILIGARRGSPLAIGYGERQMFFGSDALAIAPFSNKLSYLEEGDWAIIKPGGAEIYNSQNLKVERPIVQSSLDPTHFGKGGYAHYMLKEIYEQPQVIGDTLNTMIDPATGQLSMPDILNLKDAAQLNFVACGTSYYAALVGKYWLEKIARVPVTVELASEFRYRDPVLNPGQISVFISQSGETADTLAALRHAKTKRQQILSIVNVLESSIARESDIVIECVAGPERSVASTKAFTAQLTILASLALVLASQRGALASQEQARMVRALMEAPAIITQLLSDHRQYQKIAREILAPAVNALFLGRGTSFPLAMEGALKLKETSYIHAEGYPSGEIKHGPIAMVDEKLPVLFVAPDDDWLPKTISNLEEVKSRGGQTIFIGSKQTSERLSGLAGNIIMPDVDPFVSPLVYAVPLQLMAYYTAVAKGTDVDQPRNLAKSVTVE